jgi:hypothetical protein
VSQLVNQGSLERLANRLHAMWQLREELDGDMPRWIMWEGEQLGLDWVTDDPTEAAPYVRVGYTFLSPRIFPEVDDGTYGILQGWRIFLDVK